jgi:hypothetical protein
MLPRAPSACWSRYGFERVELTGARSLPAAVDELLPRRGAVEPQDGVQAPAQVAGDLAEPPPFGAQPVHWGVVPPGALGVLPVGAGLFRFRQRRALFFQGGRDRLDDHPGQVRQQTPRSSEPGHDKHASSCDNDTTGSWKNSSLSECLINQVWADR